MRIEPLDPLTTTVSYFLGSDPAEWHADVPVYGGVRYAGLYPGVDLVIGSQDSFWRLEAQPGAEAATVRLRVEGSDAATLHEGSLRLSTTAGDLALSLPISTFGFDVEVLDQTAHSATFALQPTDLSAGLTRIQVSRETNDDPSDPIYSTYLGGSPYWDQINAVAVDSAGRATVAGITESNVFPTTPGASTRHLAAAHAGRPPTPLPVQMPSSLALAWMAAPLSTAPIWAAVTTIRPTPSL